LYNKVLNIQWGDCELQLAAAAQHPERMAQCIMSLQKIKPTVSVEGVAFTPL
jgi:hypothetical protein